MSEELRREVSLAASRLVSRAEWSARVGENDEFTIGGAPAVVKYLEDRVDTTRPMNYHWGDFSAALDRLIAGYERQLAEAEERIQKDGALW